MQGNKVYDPIDDAFGIKFIKERGPRDLIANEISGTISNKIARIYFFRKKYVGSLVGKENWNTHKIQLSRDLYIWYTDGYAEVQVVRYRGHRSVSSKLCLGVFI